MQKLSSPIDLIKKAVNLFSKKENFIFLVKIYLPITILSVISILLGNSKSFGFIVFFTTMQLLFIFIDVFVTTSGIIALKNVVDDGELSIKNTYKIAQKKYWKFLLLYVALVVTYLCGFILLVIPGILFIVWYAFSEYIMIEKGTNIKESFVKSKELVKGNFWKILGRLIVFGLFIIIIQMALSAIPYGIGSIVISLCGGLFMLPTYLLYRELSA